MKVIDVTEAAGNLSNLIAEATAGHLIVLRDGDKQVELYPHPTIDASVDSPELEAELLKTANGPFVPYSREDLRAFTEELIRKHKANAPAR